MLTDATLLNLNPNLLSYEGSERDGICVTVSPVGAVTFRCDSGHLG
jgi:hypothetical protein